MKQESLKGFSFSLLHSIGTGTTSKLPSLKEEQLRVLQHFLQTGYQDSYFPKRTYLLAHVRTMSGRTIYTKMTKSTDKKHSEEHLVDSKDDIQRDIRRHLHHHSQDGISILIFLTYSPCFECADALGKFADDLSSTETINVPIEVKVYFPHLYNMERKRPNWEDKSWGA